MDPIQVLSFLVNSLITIVPQLIVTIIGIIFCFSNWSQHPKASKMTLLGLVIMFVITISFVVFSVLQTQLWQWFVEVPYISAGIRIILNILWAVGLALIIFAVWADRKEK